jgi:hypothetical protein
MRSRNEIFLHNFELGNAQICTTPKSAAVSRKKVVSDVMQEF